MRCLIPLLVPLPAAACTTTGAPPAPTEPTLFYARNGSIYLSDLNGSPAQKLTDGPGDTQPAPSPDGRRVAYVHKTRSDEAGGELWVVDVASGAKRRLVDPADLAPKFTGEDRPGIEDPRWSPAGDRIAFLKSSAGGGGFLLTATPDTGAVTAPPEIVFADFGYTWSPDGTHIAWVGGRSDVSPVDVNVLTIGGESTSVAKDTNAFAVSYSGDGSSVLFANGDAHGRLYAAIPFVLRDGGIYSVEPPAQPTPLISGTAAYADVTGLPSGAVGFTEWSQDWRTKSVLVLGPDRTLRKIADTPGDAPRPAWAGEDGVAYIGTADDHPLMVSRKGVTTTVDVGADAFAWAG